MRFGTSDAARRKGQRFSTRNESSDGEKSGARGFQAARPFYGPAEGDEAAILAGCEKAVADFLGI